MTNAKDLLNCIDEVVKKQGDKWVVKSKSGKTLGTHPTKTKALSQLAAVEINKKKS